MYQENFFKTLTVRANCEQFVLVTRGGTVLTNFKIVKINRTSKDAIKVSFKYSLKHSSNVNFTYNEYSGRIEASAYYVVNLKAKKIIRICAALNEDAMFDHKCSRTYAVFLINTDYSIRLEEIKERVYLICFDSKNRTQLFYANPFPTPVTGLFNIDLIDLKNSTVQKVQDCFFIH